MKKNIAIGLTLFSSMLFSSGNLYAFDEVANRTQRGQVSPCSIRRFGVMAF